MGADPPSEPSISSIGFAGALPFDQAEKHSHGIRQWLLYDVTVR